MSEPTIFPKFDYSLATSAAIERARNLIRQFDLHRNPNEPVDISVLLDKFDVRFLEDLPDTTWGFTLDLNHKIIVAINDKLNADLMRFVAMHEVGHVAMWHPNQLNACVVQGQEAYDRLEAEATTVAAYLLVPRLPVVTELIFGNSSVNALAERLLVPTDLVIIRRELCRRTRL